MLTNLKQSQVENGSLTVDSPSNMKVTGTLGRENWRYGNICIQLEVK